MEFVYVLQCEEDAWYVGVTCHWGKRFARHWQGKGAVYTRIYKPVGVRFLRACRTRNEAEWWECTLTATLQQRKLKVGGGLKTRPSLAGRGRAWDEPWYQMLQKFGGVE